MKTPTVAQNKDLVKKQGVIRREDAEEGAVKKWTYREVNWYLAEDRLLFASDDELEICRWNVLFQWLLERAKQ